ncbi:MAG TPA: hypothetical protein VMD06_10105 [Steroidobacteraceae bacterium]|nr:hypothetical protein [Steroidobacteraceae bacterium]
MNVHLIRPLKHSLAGLGVVLASSLGLAQMAGATTISRAFIVFVPAAQDHAFNLGTKVWEKCLHAHGTKEATYVYDAETGDVSRYLFLSKYSAWSGMDAHDTAGKACQATFVSQVLPHVGKAYSEIAERNDKDTYMPGGDPYPPPILWFDGFRIKTGQAAAFHDGLAQFAAAAAKTHWMGHFVGWDIDASGQGGEDFVLVWPNKNWADVGTDPSPSAKAMMDSVYGAANAEAMHQKFMASVHESWSDAWSYDKDLSIIPRE